MSNRCLGEGSAERSFTSVIFDRFPDDQIDRIDRKEESPALTGFGDPICRIVHPLYIISDDIYLIGGIFDCRLHQSDQMIKQIKKQYDNRRN